MLKIIIFSNFIHFSFTGSNNMIVLQTLVLTTILFIACWLSLPPGVVAGGNNHGNIINGIDILLATGMVAKLLQKKKHSWGGKSAQLPIGGQAREGTYGAQSVKIVVPQQPAPPPPPPPPMYYQQPMYQPQTMTTYSQATHVMPQHVPRQPIVQHTVSQAPISTVSQSGYSGAGYPLSNAQQTTVYGYFTEFQPRDKVEVVRM